MVLAFVLVLLSQPTSQAKALAWVSWAAVVLAAIAASLVAAHGWPS